jgi:ubiquitin-like protein Nedd8
MLVYIKWMTTLEPVYCHETDSIGELRRRMMTAARVPLEHKLLVYQCLLLRDSMLLSETGVQDDSTIYLVLNEKPFQGKEMLVKTFAVGGSAAMRTIYVTENFKIQDVKEDLYAFPGEAAPESQVLVFIGKQLENDRTLREYNIQKGSCLRVINAGFARNDIKSFVRCTYPAADALNVPLNTSIVVQLTSIDEDESEYWGHLLGSPNLETILPQQVLAMHARERQRASTRQHTRICLCAAV